MSSYIIKENYPIQDLFSKTEILKDNAISISIKEILAPTSKFHFEPLKDTVIKDSKAVWLKISLLSKIDFPNPTLLFKRNAPPYKDIAGLDSVLVYFANHNQIIAQTKTGVYIPSSEKKLKNHVTVNSFPIPLEKGAPLDIYLHVFDKDLIFTNLELREASIPINTESNTFLIIISSFGFILSIYVLFFYFFTKDISYLHLFGVFLLRAIHYQLLTWNLDIITLFFPEHPQWIEILWVLTTIPSIILLLVFTRSFLSLKDKNSIVDKIAKILIYILLIITLISLILVETNPSFYYQIENIIGGFSFISFIAIITRLAFYKDALTRYIVFATGWFFIFNILGILFNLGILPFYDLLNPWVIGQMGFTIILSLAIARKMQLSERAKLEVEKVREIDSIKSKFFANISHEFRTPLSLIMGPINQSMENLPASENIDNNTEIPVKGKHLNVMKRNAQRLQNLVDQILDLSKLDQGKMKLQVEEGPIIQFLRALVFSFESLAEIKHIELKTYFPKAPNISYFDRDALEKIIVNLISNAIKFTPEHGRVSVMVEDTGKNIKIHIQDTGPGLNPQEVFKVFDRFYQTETTKDQGTGIGLALVKELIELYKGQIHVESVEGEGTTFKLLIPYQKEAFQDIEFVNKKTPSSDKVLSHSMISEDQTLTFAENKSKELPWLLIVEDNPDLRDYIAEHLATDFQILLAKDGSEGFALAEKNIPDIIISDVMMPKMSGIELCKKIKEDIKTSHIPVILLTAKAEQQDKIEGLEIGADDYVTKPFDRHELIIRAKNLIQQRELLREKYSGQIKIGPSEVNLNSMDERFMNQVITTIEEHMGNEFYSVEDLATAVGFSRSQLNRKLKNVVGKSPNQLIRDFRLQRAKELLIKKTGTVSEIAYEVGYSNMSYFSKSYKEAFGKLPSEE